MAAETSTQREKQEQSIKARKNELFVGEEVQTGPRKKFRDILRETPAAPLSKNVKLMLWGSAAPVVLLFLAALLAGNKSSRAKAPEYLLPPPSIGKLTPAKTEVASRSSDQPPAATEAKPENPPDQEKPKAKPKKPKKPKAKPKPKDDTAVAQANEGEKTEKTEGDSKDSGTKKTSGTASSTKDKAAKGKTSTTPATPDKPRRAPMLVKKKKPPVFTYPKREGEKKDESKTTPDSDASAGLP